MECIKLNEITLYGESIKEWNHLEGDSYNRLYYKKDKHVYSFVCLKLDGYPADLKTYQEKWDQGSLIATIYGTVNFDGLKTVNLTGGDIRDIGTNEDDDGQLELSGTQELIDHLKLIQKLEEIAEN